MTSPISNDNSPAVNQDRNLKTRGQENNPRPGVPGPAQQASGNEPTAPSAEPDIARAAHFYHAETTAHPSGGASVEGADEARLLVEQLKERMLADPGAALAAFGRPNPQQAAAVLGQGPA